MFRVSSQLHSLTYESTIQAASNVKFRSGITMPSYTSLKTKLDCYKTESNTERC